MTLNERLTPAQRAYCLAEWHRILLPQNVRAQRRLDDLLLALAAHEKGPPAEAEGQV